MVVYKRKALVEPSFIQKLLKQSPKENSIIEINNLLEASENLKDVLLDDVLNVGEKYKINLKKKFKQQRLDIFKQYLLHCLSDQKLEESELDALRHLRHILLINEDDTQNLLKQETENIYKNEVKNAVEDGELTSEEQRNLEKIKSDLLIPDDIANHIYENSSTEILKKFVEGAISDKRLSPDEEMEMHKIAKSLNIDLQLTESTKALLDKYRLYWQIENSTIPELPAEINIQKSEKLHFKTPVNWLEQRRVTRRINYGGPTMRIKIAKGVYWRTGSLGVQRVSEDVWQTIDQGTLYLTNKRLIFMGTKANKNIRLNKVLDFTPYKNGVDIQKDSGKSPFLEFSENIDIFSMILARLVDEL